MSSLLAPDIIPCRAPGEVIIALSRGLPSMRALIAGFAASTLCMKVGSDIAFCARGDAASLAFICCRRTAGSSATCKARLHSVPLSHALFHLLVGIPEVSVFSQNTSRILVPIKHVDSFDFILVLECLIRNHNLSARKIWVVTSVVMPDSS